MDTPQKTSRWDKSKSATDMLREKQAARVEYERPKLIIQGNSFPVYLLEYKMNYLYTSASYQHEWHIELHQFQEFSLIQLSSLVSLEVGGLYYELEIVGFQLKGTNILSLHLRPKIQSATGR